MLELTKEQLAQRVQENIGFKIAVNPETARIVRSIVLESGARLESILPEIALPDAAYLFFEGSRMGYEKNSNSGRRYFAGSPLEEIRLEATPVQTLLAGREIRHNKSGAVLQLKDGGLYCQSGCDNYEAVLQDIISDIDFEVVTPWQDTLKEHPIWCWVSRDENKNNTPRLIKTVDEEANNFVDSDGFGWKVAAPMRPEEVEGCTYRP